MTEQNFKHFKAPRKAENEKEVVEVKEIVEEVVVPLKTQKSKKGYMQEIILAKLQHKQTLAENFVKRGHCAMF
jgi:hypothetical protein